MIRQRNASTTIDPDLMSRAQCDDAVAREAARHELVGHVRPMVEHAVRRMRTPRWLRDDAIQEGFVGVFEALKKFDSARGTPFGQFAYTFVLGRVRALVHPPSRWVPRADARPRSILFGEREAEDDSAAVYEMEIPGTVDPDPLDEILKIELANEVSRFISSLDIDAVEVIRACYWNDMSQAAAARAIGCSPMTVSRRMVDVRLAGRFVFAAHAA